MAKPRNKTLWSAGISAISALLVTVAMVIWAYSRPETVLVGAAGRHDGASAGARLAACLDCHVPFVGTPGSRCLGPDCHGELATGTPPLEGPAMPVRFHVALREHSCRLCHQEHFDRTPGFERQFSHDLIPPANRERCTRCHTSAGEASHANADRVDCDVCHGVKTFTGAQIDHERVPDLACDLCHKTPATTAHDSIAGTCTDCHHASSWIPLGS